MSSSPQGWILPDAWKITGQSLAPLNVVERDFSIDEIREAVAEGRLLEAFAAGTAYFVKPVDLIHHRGENIVIPLPSATSPSYARLIKGWLSDIVFGVNDPFGWATELPSPSMPLTRTTLQQG
ncbi:hypothetical protein NQ176_g8937 [Zarea fungicola]|uniref:Uncharacterized protein n=1 Tax=Zarea fungicola TaxID=93591 RepID=A0ACC1MQN8_9HYPO|nr:hypothetical protein NQ176_g8937 [Lecanicillium fungicola]